MFLIKLLIIIPLWTLSLFGAHFINAGQTVTLHLLKQSRALPSAPANALFYQDDHGKTYGVTDEIIVSFNDLSAQAEIEKTYQLKRLKRLSTTMFLYKIAQADQTLTQSTKLHSEPAVKFAQPNFILQKQKRTADPYYKYLWHLKNSIHAGADINVETAWQYTKGAGITGAVIDEGIDIGHDDLRANIAGFANYDDPDSNYPASKTGEWHGTACAGLMVAAENHTGVVGVAPEARLYAVRYSDSDIAQDIRAFYDLMQEGVSVISNSWGSYSNLDAYNEIFKELATKGRDGKGILIFFAAGNDTKNLDTPGIDDESESEYVTSITASTNQDNIAPYCNYGSSVDFAAPGGSFGGELVTTDAMGEAGYTTWNYNFHFIGTSAAAPVAAGVAMLILAENPDLTRDEVLDILRQTAVKIGSYPYDANGYNIYAGYGRIDAGRAVALAHRYKLKTTGEQPLFDNFAHVMFESVAKFSD